MRIISGDKKGVRLSSPKYPNLRPTTDSNKELIFNVLGENVEQAFVLDIFAGTGSLGIEALSRGAAKAIFIDQDHRAKKVIATNLSTSGLTHRAEIICAPANKAIRDLAKRDRVFGLIFLDPPYHADLLIRTLHELQHHDLLAPNGWLVAEHSYRTHLEHVVGKYRRTACKRQGETQLSFYCNG